MTALAATPPAPTRHRAAPVLHEPPVLGSRVGDHGRRRWRDLVAAGPLHSESAEERARVDHLLDLLDLRSVANTGASVLPPGPAPRVEVARALATGPSIVLL